MSSMAMDNSSFQSLPHLSDKATAENSRMLRVVDRGFVRRAEPGTCHATFTYPTAVALSSGRLLATFRSGSTKDTAEETIELFESSDGGRTWCQRPFPLPTEVNGKHGSARCCYITEIEPGHLLGAVMWVDRETYPAKPLFNPETEGCLPMEILLSDSYDFGATWSKYRVVPMPAEIGPPSITSAIMKSKGGTLAMSIESNKIYEDRSKWYQRVVLFHSADKGQTWGPAVMSGCDPTGRIFNWDQRADVAPDGRIVAFIWTYDSETNTYLNIHRRISSDKGYTWSQAQDLGFADQAGHPAILPDGRVVLSYVDRFNSQSIRARWAPDISASFDQETETVIYAHQTATSVKSNTGTTKDALVDMGVWSYGLPYAEVLPDGDVIVLYYAGNSEAMNACWARLCLP